MERVDVAIVGGGVMGASAAFWLMQAEPGLNVLVLERDPSFSRASTALSAASIRQQFSTAVNVKISRFGIDFIRSFADHVGPEADVPDLALRENGYLFLAGTEAGAGVLRDCEALQRAEGAATALLTPEELSARYPWMRTADVALASLGLRDEGWFDNMGLLQGFRRAAAARGAILRNGRVTGLARRADRIEGLELADGTRIACGHLVNAAGTSAAALLQMVGEDLPVEPRKRTVFVFDAPEARFPDAPLTIDHSGCYFRPEGRHWLAGLVPKEDGPADPDDFEPDLHAWERDLWPRLYERSEHFAAAKVLRAWAGHYAYNTLDQNALIGRAPGWQNFWLMNGFSGHGLQQSPAMGRAMAELILTGGFRTLDLSDLDPARITTGTPLLEQAVV